MGTESVAAYYASAIPRAFGTAWDWAIGQGILLTILSGVATVVYAGLRVLFSRHGTNRTTAGMVARLVLEIASVFVLLAFILFVVFFIQDAPNEIRIRDEKIVQLGGAPDAPIAVSQSLRGTNDIRVFTVLGDLSEIINKDMQVVCDEAKDALTCIRQIRNVQPSDCAAKTERAFTGGRAILNMLWTSADRGFLNAGDPELLEILNQAIQRIDRQVFIDFDQYALSSYNALHFLSLVQSSGEESARLFEPALNLSDGPNRWGEATQRYCEFIGKTNRRIAEIREQLSR